MIDDYFGFLITIANKAIGVFQTGSTGCVLSFNHVIWSRME
jgi:hypothetical protein